MTLGLTHVSCCISVLVFAVIIVRYDSIIMGLAAEKWRVFTHTHKEALPMIHCQLFTAVDQLIFFSRIFLIKRHPYNSISKWKFWCNFRLLPPLCLADHLLLMELNVTRILIQYLFWQTCPSFLGLSCFVHYLHPRSRHQDSSPTVLLLHPHQPHSSQFILCRFLPPILALTHCNF